MLNTRKELYSLARKNYVSLLTRAARRYENSEIYLTVDHVGYECTRLEELFRPLWGIAPFLGDVDFKISVNGKRVHGFFGIRFEHKKTPEQMVLPSMLYSVK